MSREEPKRRNTQMRSLRGTPLVLLPIKFVYVGIREFVEAQGLRFASALAYTTLLSLIPLAVVGLSVWGMFADKKLKDENLVRSALETILWPEETQYEVTPNPEALANPGTERTREEVQAILNEALGEDEEPSKKLTEEGLQAFFRKYDESLFQSRVVASSRDQLVEGLMGFVDNLRGDLKTIGFIGVLLLLISAISLFNTIESTFNLLWSLQRNRPALRKFLLFWAVLTLGPVLVGASFVARKWGAESVLEPGLNHFFLPYVLSVAALWLLYVLVPKTRVSLIGAAVAALLIAAAWELLKLLFGSYVISIFQPGSKNSNVIAYGSLALIPIFMLWVYLSWCLVLAGVKLCYVWQNLAMYTGRQWQEAAWGTAAEEMLAARIVTQLAVRQYEEGGGLTLPQITRSLRVPQFLVEETLDCLRNEKLILEEADTGCLVLAHPPDDLTLDQVIAAIRGHELPPRATHSGADEALGQVLGRLSASRREILGSATVAELARAASVPGPPPASD